MRLHQRVDLALALLIAGAVGWTVFQGSSWLFNELFGIGLPRGWGARAGLFPTVIGLPLLALAIVQVVIAARRHPTSAAGFEGDLPADVVWPRALGVALAIAGFAAGVWLLGFLIALPTMTFAYLRFAARESWVLSLGLAAAFALLFYGLFIELLRVKLPEGLLLSLLVG